MSLTNAMNERGFICQDIFVGIGKSPQVVNLNQGVAMSVT